jgi:hypothetical protein
MVRARFPTPFSVRARTLDLPHQLALQVATRRRQSRDLVAFDGAMLGAAACLHFQYHPVWRRPASRTLISISGHAAIPMLPAPPRNGRFWAVGSNGRAPPMLRTPWNCVPEPWHPHAQGI